MTRVAVPSRMLQWAIDRSDVPEDNLRNRFDKLPEWLAGDRRPTLKQLEAFAKATHTPIGYLFLQEPPGEPVPIPDFRTIAAQLIAHPSPNLLDTIYLCQQRQEWYRDYARSLDEDPLPFIGTARNTDDITATAERVREALQFDLDQRRRFRTWTDALRHFIEKIADEIDIGDDELTEWARQRGHEFFLRPDNALLQALPRVSEWTAAQRYEAPAVATFLEAADYCLIAHALAHGHIVVTHEVAANTAKKVKIPNVCTGLEIKCMTPFQMLRKQHARFVLPEAQNGTLWDAEPEDES